VFEPLLAIILESLSILEWDERLSGFDNKGIFVGVGLVDKYVYFLVVFAF